MKPLYRESLDQSHCTEPGCNHSGDDGWTYLHAGCHPSTKTWSKYMDGVLVIECGACGRTVVALAIASEKGDPARR
jgi:hypothetical protein